MFSWGKCKVYFEDMSFARYSEYTLVYNMKIKVHPKHIHHMVHQILSFAYLEVEH